MAKFTFNFTVRCPHCGNLFEVSHFSLEVLSDITELGECPKCDGMVVAHLTSRAADYAPHSPNCALVQSLIADCNCGAYEPHSR